MNKFLQTGAQFHWDSRTLTVFVDSVLKPKEKNIREGEVIDLLACETFKIRQKLDLA